MSASTLYPARSAVPHFLPARGVTPLRLPQHVFGPKARGICVVRRCVRLLLLYFVRRECTQRFSEAGFSEWLIAMAEEPYIITEVVHHPKRGLDQTRQCIPKDNAMDPGLFLRNGVYTTDKDWVMPCLEEAPVRRKYEALQYLHRSTRCGTCFGGKGVYTYKV